MKVVLHVNNAAHQREHCAAMESGLKRHGIDVSYAPYNSPRACDVAVVWGWRQTAVIKAGAPLLVMERGHVQPRMEYTSVGWGGLGRRATYAKAADGGERWDRLFGHHMQDWRPEGEFVVVCGQVPGDAAIHGLDLQDWASRMVREAREAFGRPVLFRPHPLCVRRAQMWCPDGAEMSIAPLADDLARAFRFVTYNSTVGVETVLGGVPTITMDEGAMAWPVAAHGFEMAPYRPDRMAWSHDLAWTNFSLDEISSGFAWEAVGGLRTEMAA